MVCSTTRRGLTQVLGRKMGLLGKSLNELRAERDALQAEIDSQAMRLTGRMVSSDQLISQLTPLTTKLVALKRQILLKTPRSELVARRKELERLLTLPSARPTPDELSLRSELSNLKLHLDNPRHRPLTLKAFLIVAAIVIAAIYLPNLVVDWLAP